MKGRHEDAQRRVRVTKAMTTRSGAVVTAAALLVLGAVLGARGLSETALWYDEYWSVYDAGGAYYGPLTPDGVWARVAQRNPWQAPGFFVLLNGWGALVGWREPAARALAWLVGLLAAAWVYRLGRTLGGRLVGVGALTALVGSAFVTAYWYEIRGYTFILLFSAVAGWGYLRLMRARGAGAWAGALALFIGTAGALYTHYFAVVTSVAIACWHVGVGIETARRRAADRDSTERGGRWWRWWRVVVVMAAAGLMFVPWAAIMLRALALATGAESEARHALAFTPRIALDQLVYWASSGAVPLLALLMIYAVWPVRRPRQTQTGGAWFALVWLAAGFACALVVNAFVPVLIHARYLMPLFVPLALLVGFGVARLHERGAAPVVVLGVWIAAGVGAATTPGFIPLTLNGAGYRMPLASVDAVRAELSAHAGADDVLLWHVIAQGDEWWSDPVIAHYSRALPLTQVRQMETISGDAGDAYRAAVLSFVEDAPFVWTAVLPDVPSAYHVADAAAALDTRYALCGETTYGAMRLSLWAHPRELTRNFSGRWAALGLLQPLAVEGETLRAVVGVSADIDVIDPAAHSVALHVTDASGRLVAQDDAPLAPRLWSCLLARVDVRTLAAGRYTVAGLIYNWQTGERLPTVEGDRIMLGEFNVP